ncbi:MAG: hypothetical protein FWB95_05865, partial [Treponema sp.]|nr:hypothetical protein [Treponema sp.]
PPPKKTNMSGWLKFTVIAILTIIGLVFSSCEDKTKCNKNCLKIGDTGPGGGIVFYHNHFGFYMDFDPKTYEGTGPAFHYLEAAPADQGLLPWNRTIGVDGLYIARTMLGAGKKNTDALLAKLPNAPAAKACVDYRGGGFADWYLPNVAELKEMYEKKDILGMNPEKLTLGEAFRLSGSGNMLNLTQEELDREVTSYWSSQTETEFFPYAVSWRNGSPYKLPIQDVYYVRAIRAF